MPDFITTRHRYDIMAIDLSKETWTIGEIIEMVRKTRIPKYPEEDKRQIFQDAIDIIIEDLENATLIRYWKREGIIEESRDPEQ